MIFSYQKKKMNFTSAKKLKRGYKNRSNKITKRRGLILCGGESTGLFLRKPHQQMKNVLTNK